MNCNLFHRIQNFHTIQLSAQYGNDRIKLFFATILANFLVGCSAIMLLILIVFSVFSISLLEGKAFFVFLPLQVFLLCMFLVAYKLLINGRYAVGCNVFTSTVIGGILLSVMITGGFPESVATPCLILPPIITYMLYGKKAGIWMTVAVPIFVSIQWLAVGLGGVVLPDFTSQIAPAANVVLVISVSYFVAVSIVASYEFQNRILREELAGERQNLSELANRDPLTGLYNSRYFHMLIESRIEQVRTNDDVPAVMYIDLDNFKPINDVHGHPAGDEALKIVASRMAVNVRERDIVARIGGDEFAILIWNVESEDDVKEICERLRSEISVPIRFGDVLQYIGASVGYSIFHDKSRSVKYHLQIADNSMYRDKEFKENRKAAMVRSNHTKLQTVGAVKVA